MVLPLRCMVTFLVTFASLCSAQSVYRPPADEKCACSPVMNPVVNCGTTGNDDIQVLKTEMAAMAERVQQQQGDIQQLQTEGAAKDQSIQQLRDEINQLQNETAAENQRSQNKTQQLQSEMVSKDQRTQTEIQELKTEMAARDERIQQQQDDLQQLLGESETKDQRIQALEQRTYIEHCESGVLDTPYNVLASGSGSRYRDLTATFSTPFRTTPVVTVGIRKLDIYRSRNTRISTTVTSKSPRSLTVRIITWADTRVHVAGIYWMACA
ncbi:uncharacterized protein LOC118427693 isoform X3 [Branchiostoma floridae]|uniref:Uncharacterized protein LOC118427693 isoform X3 n=1 Tax=Branchiostoma floridae TaxID=7739 RepID=A0A9J7N6S9_BRAFL|nr:uncharacterized protein LOC118427693 isoform X3 [Branchiostoma floridae]